jgi:hypothetical protein
MSRYFKHVVPNVDDVDDDNEENSGVDSEKLTTALTLAEENKISIAKVGAIL